MYDLQEFVFQVLWVANFDFQVRGSPPYKKIINKTQLEQPRVVWGLLKIDTLLQDFSQVMEDIKDGSIAHSFEHYEQPT